MFSSAIRHWSFAKSTTIIILAIFEFHILPAGGANAPIFHVWDHANCLICKCRILSGPEWRKKDAILNALPLALSCPLRCDAAQTHLFWERLDTLNIHFRWCVLSLDKVHPLNKWVGAQVNKYSKKKFERMGCAIGKTDDHPTCLASHQSALTIESKEKTCRSERRKKWKMISSLEKNARVAHSFSATVFRLAAVSSASRAVQHWTQARDNRT